MSVLSPSPNPPPEKLGVFISSTIKECKQERDSAKSAVLSINHRPLLFEDRGARPHPPRVTYLRLIADAAIFIGIYAEEYGWIGPGQLISGIDDELHEAQRRGMPMLIYIRQDAPNRDIKLKSLLEDFKEKAEITYASYRDSVELYQLIRDDVTAILAERFATSSGSRVTQRDSPEAVLEAAGHSGVPLVVRQTIVERLDALLAKGSACVVGGMGSGKSILLAQYAKDRGYLYIDCSYMSPLEAYSKCAGALREEQGQLARLNTSLGAAITELKNAVSAAKDFTVIVDDCRDVGVLLEIVAEAHASGGAIRRVCASARYARGIFFKCCSHT